MNDRLNNLDARLARLRPRPISAALEDHIAEGLAASGANRTDDRFLWSAIVSGALAACVVIALLINDATSGSRFPRQRVIYESAMQDSTGPMLASADHRWGDELNAALNWSFP